MMRISQTHAIVHQNGTTVFNCVLQGMYFPGEAGRGGWFPQENQFSSCEILELATPRLF